MVLFLFFASDWKTTNFFGMWLMTVCSVCNLFFAIEITLNSCIIYYLLNVNPKSHIYICPVTLILKRGGRCSESYLFSKFYSENQTIKKNRGGGLHHHLLKERPRFMRIYWTRPTLSTKSFISQPAFLLTPFWIVLSIRTKIAHSSNALGNFNFSKFVKS